MKIKIILLTIFAAVCVSCNKPEPTITLKSPIIYHFMPSFDPYSELIIQEDTIGKFYLTLKIGAFWDSTQDYDYYEHIITKSDIDSILIGFEKFNEVYSSPQKSEGLDGTSYRIISDRFKQLDTLYFWSPDRDTEPEYYYLLDPIRRTLEKAGMGYNEEKYIYRVF